MKVVGMKEGEWFQRWEGTIKRAVGGRLKTNQPLVDPDGPTPAALMLDGVAVMHNSLSFVYMYSVLHPRCYYTIAG